MRKCRFCASEIPDAARVCPHCQRDLIPGHATGAAPAQNVTVTGVDPFGHLHAEIHGKKAGSITVVGYMGIGLGVLLGLVALLAWSQGPQNAGAGFGLLLAGVGVAIASYLWVRR
jgi:hypothetical protein